MFCAQDAWIERGTGFYRLWIRTKDDHEEMVFATSVRSEIDLVWTQLAAVLPADVSSRDTSADRARDVASVVIDALRMPRASR